MTRSRYVWPDNREVMFRGDAYEVLYSDKDVLIYLRGSDAIVAINRNSTPQEIQIEGVAEGIWTLAFTSMPDTQASLLSLPARSARFLSKPLNERIIAGRIIEAAAER